MGIGEICKREVVVTYKSVVLSEAARAMRDRHAGSLVVVEDTDRGRLPVGMLTDRDITVAVVARDLDARNMAVGDIMTPNPLTVREGETFLDTLRLMRRHGIRRAPVVGEHGELVGIVAIDDVIDVLAGEMTELAGAIRSEQAREARARG